MANFLRLLVGIALLPLCWAFCRSLVDGLVVAAGGSGSMFSVESCSLLAGMVVFVFCWMTISHPVRAYVLGHELTHALWGLLFGARPSDVKVSESGGSVKLTKSNVVITLAPYFFPFYTFLVIVVALITYAFLRPLPFLPLWLFAIGFTWAFHVLFTLETLSQRQPDVKLYGRIFSWTVILIINIALVLVWLASMTPLTFAGVWESLSVRAQSAYLGVWGFCRTWTLWGIEKLRG